MLTLKDIRILLDLVRDESERLYHEPKEPIVEQAQRDLGQVRTKLNRMRVDLLKKEAPQSSPPQ